MTPKVNCRVAPSSVSLAVSVCLSVYTRTCMHAYVCTYIRNTHAHTHTHTHTHTPCRNCSTAGWTRQPSALSDLVSALSDLVSVRRDLVNHSALCLVEMVDHHLASLHPNTSTPQHLCTPTPLQGSFAEGYRALCARGGGGVRRELVLRHFTIGSYPQATSL